MSSGLTLYYAPFTRATRPLWLLEELEVPYHLKVLNLKLGEHKQLEYLKIHPLGAVPALVDGDLCMFESVAICMYLADRFADKGLAPPLTDPGRALYYQWLTFANATLEPSIVQVHQHTQALPEGERSPQQAERARVDLRRALKLLDQTVADRDSLLPGGFSTADVVIQSMLGWARSLGLLEGETNLVRYGKTLTSRSAFQRARSR